VNLSQFLTRIRDELDDNAKLKYSDAELVRHIDEQSRTLCRLQMRANKEWSNFAVALQSEDARKLFNNTYEWKLPSWIEAVKRVYIRVNSDGTGESTFSHYNWTLNTQTLGTMVSKTDATRRSGWSWEGNHTFRLWNFTFVPELTLEVVADPSPMFKAAILNIPAAPVATSFFLPPALAANDLGERGYVEEGIYVNGEVQVTATTGAADLKLGQTRRIVYSNAATIDSGTRRHQLTFESSLASNVAVGDTIETLIPVAAMHSRILMLKVLNAAAVKKFNIDLQRSIGAELGEEMAAFTEWASKPRDSNGPFYMLSSPRMRAPYDPDTRQMGYVQGAWQ
jgi:hypothetical protein